jgi:hypothetical protein
MTPLKFMLSFSCLIASLTLNSSHPSKGQTQGADLPDSTEQKIGPIILENEYFVDGLAKLNIQSQGVGFAIEFLPGTRNSPPPPDSRFSTERSSGTLKDALDWLCGLDPRYTWKREGRIINIIPRDTLSDPNYLFNRKLSGLRFVDLRHASDTFDKIFKPVSKVNESVISLDDAGSFSKPWTVAFENISVRDALDRVAENLGAGRGWMVYGNNETRIINFYERLLTNAEAERRKSHN